MKQNKGAMPRGIKLRLKVFLYFAFFTAMILLILWLFQTMFLSDIYENIKLKELYRSADTVTANIESDELQSITESVARKNELCILVISPSGRTLASAEALNNCVIHKISYREHAKLYLEAKETGNSVLGRFRYDMQTGSFISVNDNSMTEEECMILTKILKNSNGEDITVFINSVLTPVGATVKTLNTMLLFITAILIVLAVTVSLIMSNSISKPIVKITDSAKTLSRGTYIPSGAKKSCREISQLSDTLDNVSLELQKNEALKRELIANISHDLRTPLTMITGYSEVMRDIPDEITPENLQIIIDESKRLSYLVNDVLEISKLQSGNITLNLEEFNLTEALRETVVRYEKMTEHNGNRFVFNYDTDVTITADKQRILQVLYNLINNAVTYTGADKTVFIVQRVVNKNGEKCVRVEISDSGEGIPQEALPYIWDRYYKVDKYHRRSQTGSGLGLSIVKTIIEMHRGAYGVHSTIGQGSTFWIELNEPTSTKANTE